LLLATRCLRMPRVRKMPLVTVTFAVTVDVEKMLGTKCLILPSEAETFDVAATVALNLRMATTLALVTVEVAEMAGVKCRTTPTETVRLDVAVRVPVRPRTRLRDAVTSEVAVALGANRLILTRAAVTFDVAEMRANRLTVAVMFDVAVALIAGNGCMRPTVAVTTDVALIAGTKRRTLTRLAVTFDVSLIVAVKCRMRTIDAVTFDVAVAMIKLDVRIVTGEMAVIAAGTMNLA